MGNCQAAEAATVVIQHPGGKVERVYWSVSASHVMTSNPGHYVAVVVVSQAARNEDGSPVRKLKLLRPDDTLHIGQVYRLVSFEEVLKQFATKKQVKLTKLLLSQHKEQGVTGDKKKKKMERDEVAHGSGSSRHPANLPSVEEERQQRQQPEERPEAAEERQHREEREEEEELCRFGSRICSSSRSKNGQWRPALQSIAEAG